jgi:MFS family permease
MGGTGDRVGNRRALVICFLVAIAALSWLQLAKEPWALFLFAAIYGFSHGGFFALVSPLIAEIFGTVSHGAIFGTLLFISQIGGAVGPTVTGRIFDVTHSYQLAFLILLAVSIIGFILSILLQPIKSKEAK